MSGSESSVRVSAVPEGVRARVDPAPSAAAVDPSEAAPDRELARRTRRGRLQMLVVLAVCAAPVIAAYVAYFGWHPQARTNYAEIIRPARPVPDDLPLADLRGEPVRARGLKGQWLLVVVSGGDCDASCERHLWIQRQLRESLGRDADRVDKLWLIDDRREASPAAIAGVESGGRPATVLRVPANALARWLEPAPGHALEDHLYIVDPHGDWMMRTPIDPDPARMKRDLDKLLRASEGWDRPGR
jgi:hypothetical protein